MTQKLNSMDKSNDLKHENYIIQVRQTQNKQIYIAFFILDVKINQKLQYKYLKKQ